MINIAIIDDNKDQRETYAIRLRQFFKELESDIHVIDLFPFEEFSDYNVFIQENDISAIITDERLHNDSQPDRLPVGYNGSDMVVPIRTCYKYLPIFVLTNHTGDVEEDFNKFEYIIAKGELSIKHAEIIQRACQRYLEENQRELSTLNDLTRKIASGTADQDEVEKLKALQQKLVIPLSTELKERNEWLTELERQISVLQEIKSRLENKLNEK